MDFRFKHFVRADGRPFANCPLLFGVGAFGVLTRRSALKCGGCGVVPYCSKACQTQHWKKPAGAHKGECAAFAALKKKKQAEGGH